MVSGCSPGCTHMEVSNRGTPSHSPFRTIGFSLAKNHPVSLGMAKAGGARLGHVHHLTSLQATREKEPGLQLGGRFDLGNPLAIWQFAIEHGHGNSCVPYESWWFAIAKTVHQRLSHSSFRGNHAKWSSKCLVDPIHLHVCAVATWSCSCTVLSCQCQACFFLGPKRWEGQIHRHLGALSSCSHLHSSRFIIGGWPQKWYNYPIQPALEKSLSCPPTVDVHPSWHVLRCFMFIDWVIGWIFALYLWLVIFSFFKYILHSYMFFAVIVYKHRYRIYLYNFIYKPYSSVDGFHHLWFLGPHIQGWNYLICIHRQFRILYRCNYTISTIMLCQHNDWILDSCRSKLEQPSTNQSPPYAWNQLLPCLTRIQTLLYRNMIHISEIYIYMNMIILWPQ